jgi:hypothetical protein
MAETFEPNVPWHRFHDPPVHPGGPRAPRTVRPGSLKDIIDICKRQPDRGRLHALGSHWALSEAARSDSVFIETHDPDYVYPALGRTLWDVIPLRMDGRRREWMAQQQEPTATYVHIEAGKRICQLYAELDQVDPLTSAGTLAGWMALERQNRGYAGPWGFATLGGAGGQTVVGALITGTHGGDFDRPPLADAVVAMHLVTDGGKHYWIERQTRRFANFTKLVELYGADQYGGPSNFEVLQNDDVFNAVLVSAGRFGVIYSVVLEAVPQYTLYERQVLGEWDQVKGLIADQASQLYSDDPVPYDSGFRFAAPVTGGTRFLQVVVCLAKHSNFTNNRVSVTQRWQAGLPANPAGRAQRVGPVVTPSDPVLNAPRFRYAGASHPYHTADRPDAVAAPSFLEIACTNGDFIKGVLQATVEELEQFVESHGAVVGAGIAAVAAAGGGGLLALLGFFAVVIALLKALIDAFPHNAPLGATMENIRHTLLDGHDTRGLGLMVWQMIGLAIFESLQAPGDKQAISYAVMDSHDYLDVGCQKVGDSIEVFFDATDSMLIAFIDRLIDFEMRQELLHGRAFVGYASLRFTGQTQALIGMQKWPLTCSVEIAGLGGVAGTTELIQFAHRLALNHNVGAILHWGQHNEQTAADTERIFSAPANPPASNLGRWRAALGQLTDNGKLDGFSSAFTRQTGLEVT